MALQKRVAFLIDGAFAARRLKASLKHFPDATEVEQSVQAVMAHTELKGSELFRIYWYDAPPYDGVLTNPLDGTVTNFSTTPVFKRNQSLHDTLELKPYFAVRRGITVCHGWKISDAALKAVAATPRPLAATDLIPDIQQKGVDMRIGLDLAWLSLKRHVDAVVLVTGDSDLVPVMKFARKEGLLVYLATMGHGVRRELKAHADFVLN